MKSNLILALKKKKNSMQSIKIKIKRKTLFTYILKNMIIAAK